MAFSSNLRGDGKEIKALSKAQEPLNLYPEWTGPVSLNHQFRSRPRTKLLSFSHNVEGILTHLF